MKINEKCNNLMHRSNSRNNKKYNNFFLDIYLHDGVAESVDDNLLGVKISFIGQSEIYRNTD